MTTTRKVLRSAGLLGHGVIVIEPSNHWSAVDGWRIVAQCVDIAGALRHITSGAEVWRRSGKAWKRVDVSEEPTRCQ